MEKRDLEKAKDLAWGQRIRLNELARRLEGQFKDHERAVEPNGRGTWVGAIEDIAADSHLKADLIMNVQALVEHIRRYYPIDL
jgi:hypothetical protein